jgi:hypothetical protein
MKLEIGQWCCEEKEMVVWKRGNDLTKEHKNRDKERCTLYCAMNNESRWPLPIRRTPMYKNTMEKEMVAELVFMKRHVSPRTSRGVDRRRYARFGSDCGLTL